MSNITENHFTVDSLFLSELEICKSYAAKEISQLEEDKRINVKTAQDDINYTNENCCYVEISDCTEDVIGRLVCTIIPFQKNKNKEHILYSYNVKDTFEFLPCEWNNHIIELPFSHYDENSPFIPIILTGFISYCSGDKVQVTFPSESLESCRKYFILESIYRMIPTVPSGSYIVQFNIAESLQNIAKQPHHPKAYALHCVYSNAMPRIDERPLSDILKNFEYKTNVPSNNSVKHINEGITSSTKWDQWIKEDLKTIEPYAEKSNECQKKAICLALRSRDICCIQGPPGTGKTTTLVYLIKILTKMKLTVLVSAFSNRAVEAIYEKLVQERVKAINFKRRSYPNDRLLKLERVKSSVIPEQPKKNSLKKKKFVEETNTKDCYVVCLTCAASQLNFFTERFLSMKKKKKFDVVIVDEAGQCSSLFTWGPALLGHRLILTGDHQQLGPLSDQTSSLLNRSLFEYCIVKKHIPTYMLKVQYRMHEYIMTWSSKTFYTSQLIAHKSVQYRNLRDILNMEGNVEPFSYNPLVWIDTSYHSDSIEKYFPSNTLTCSYYNGYEATVLIEILLKFQQCLLPPAMLKVCVITPFRGQITFIHLCYENIPQLKNGYPVTSTVDYFQGGECDIVIVSLVRSNQDESVGFLNNIRRLNVAVTRAKRQLIIIGDSSTLNSNPSLRELWETVNHLGDVIPSSVIAPKNSRVCKKIIQIIHTNDAIAKTALKKYDHL